MVDVKPELVDAYELGYIRKIGMKSHVKLNAYYLSNKDQIHAQNTTNTFQNSGDNDLYGFEIEYKNIFKNRDQIYFNYSYVDGENVANELANSAKNIAKAYYIHNISDVITISTIAKFVDEKDRVETDVRDHVDGYAVFDLSVNYQYQPVDADINLSIKNLFDETYYLPSPENTYPGDFEQEGRFILLSFKKRF